MNSLEPMCRSETKAMETGSNSAPPLLVLVCRISGIWTRIVPEECRIVSPTELAAGSGDADDIIENDGGREWIGCRDVDPHATGLVLEVDTEIARAGAAEPCDHPDEVDRLRIATVGGVFPLSCSDTTDRARLNETTLTSHDLMEPCRSDPGTC